MPHIVHYELGLTKSTLVADARSKFFEAISQKWPGQPSG